jgi:nucleoside-diphosphate kinase
MKIFPVLASWKNERKGAEIMVNLQFYFPNDQLLLPLRPNLKYMSNRTFTMIKPDAMKNGHAGAILDRIIKEGFRIIALKQTRLSEEKAGEFYAIHKERPFFGELVSFMSSGAIIAAILEKENAVTSFRTLIGATDPAKADANTIRKLYATSVGENAVHGSDSNENAKIEGDFFFSGLERI